MGGPWRFSATPMAPTRKTRPCPSPARWRRSGIATLAINAVGHGFGPLGTLTVSQSVGGPVTFSAGGRGIDQDGDGLIASNEGLSTARATGHRLFQ